MRPRDRLVLSILAAAALVVAAYMLVVSPKQKQANDAGTALTAERSVLSSAQQQVTQGRAAAASYARNLQAVRTDFRAVPASDAVAQLLPTLQRSSNQRRVDFRVISVSAGGPAAAPVAAPTPAAAPGAPGAPGAPATPGAAAPAAAAAFSPTTFQFTFNGGYRLFQQFLRDLDHFVVVRGDGTVTARNRLLVINSVALKPQAPAHGYTQVAITASAYSQPPAPAAPGATR